VTFGRVGEGFQLFSRVVRLESDKNDQDGKTSLRTAPLASFLLLGMFCRSHLCSAILRRPIDSCGLQTDVRNRPHHAPYVSLRNGEACGGVKAGEGIKMMNQ